MTPASLRGVETGPDSVLDDSRCRQQRRWTTPPGDCVGRADEVERAADRADVAAAGQLAVDLAGQVDLDRGVDGDEALAAAPAPRRRACTRSCAGARARCRARSRTALCEPISSAPSMRLTTPALRELDHAVADAAGMHAQPFVAARARRTRRRAGRRCRIPAPRRRERTAAALRAMARSSSPGGRAGGIAGGRELSTTRSKSSFASSALGVRPGHLVVHLGDDRAADVERRHEVVGARARGCTRRARWAG